MLVPMPGRGLRRVACPLPGPLPWRLLAGALLALGVGACGGGPGVPIPGLGTVSVVNQTDLGSAPLTVAEFYLAPAGASDPGPNRLPIPVPPGGVVIIGLFPEGDYDAVAVLEGGGQINFPTTAVRAEQPTDFVIPGP